MMVYDCFVFFNEFELLDIRMQLLNDVVDKFVIVEADYTYQGEKKDFNFEKEAERFKNYQEKIIYLKITDMPLPVKDKEDAWKMQFFQRNSIMRALHDCQPEDIIILSDIDEIPRPEIIQAAKELKLKPSFCFPEYPLKKRIGVSLKWFFRIKILSGKDKLKKYPLVCEQQLYYYYLNNRSRGKWNGSILTRYKNFNSPQAIRDKRNRYPRIANGGWHFSYLGGIDRVIQKLKSIVEGGLANDSEEHIEKCIREGKDLYGRIGDEYTYDIVKPHEIGLPNIDLITTKYPNLYKPIL